MWPHHVSTSVSSSTSWPRARARAAPASRSAPAPRRRAATRRPRGDRAVHPVGIQRAHLGLVALVDVLAPHGDADRGVGHSPIPSKPVPATRSRAPGHRRMSRRVPSARASVSASGIGRQQPPTVTREPRRVRVDVASGTARRSPRGRGAARVRSRGRAADPGRAERRRTGAGADAWTAACMRATRYTEPSRGEAPRRRGSAEQLGERAAADDRLGSLGGDVRAGARLVVAALDQQPLRLRARPVRCSANPPRSFSPCSTKTAWPRSSASGQATRPPCS